MRKPTRQRSGEGRRRWNPAYHRRSGNTFGKPGHPVSGLLVNPRAVTFFLEAMAPKTPIALLNDGYHAPGPPAAPLAAQGVTEPSLQDKTPYNLMMHPAGDKIGRLLAIWLEVWEVNAR